MPSSAFCLELYSKYSNSGSSPCLRILMLGLQEIFLVTKVARGESADQACHEMLEDWKACQVVESLKKEETKERVEESAQK